MVSEVQIPLPDKTSTSCAFVVRELIKYILFMSGQIPGMYDDMKRIAVQFEKSRLAALNKEAERLSRENRDNRDRIDEEDEEQTTAETDFEGGEDGEDEVDSDKPKIITLNGKLNPNMDWRHERRQTQARNALSRRRNMAHRRIAKFVKGLDSLLDCIQPELFVGSSVNAVLILLGSSPLRPREAYHVKIGDTLEASSAMNQEAIEKKHTEFAKKLIRTLVQGGVGSGSDPNASTAATKVFVLLEMPASDEAPEGFLPKRNYDLDSRKSQPIHIDLRVPGEKPKSRVTSLLRSLSMVSSSTSVGSDGSRSNVGTEHIWYQCRVPLRGLRAAQVAS